MRRKYWPNGFPQMVTFLPPAQKDGAAITHFTVSEEEARRFNMSLIFSGGGYGLERIEAGKYCRLHLGPGMPMMSDTPMEQRTNWGVMHHAHGSVLIGGLGVGMVVHGLLNPDRGRLYRGVIVDPPITKILVVEKDPRVIALVGPSLRQYGKAVEVVESDVFTFTTKEKFDTIYFDIWPAICEDNLPEIAALHQRYKGRLRRDRAIKPWMDSWMTDYLRAERRRDRRGAWPW